MSEDTYEMGFWEGTEKVLKEGGGAIAMTYLDNLIGELAKDGFDPLIKNSKTALGKNVLGTSKAMVTSYVSGQTTTLISDMVTGENTYGDKQMELMQNAGWSALQKSISVGSEREHDDAKDDTKDSRDQDGWTQQYYEGQEKDAKNKSNVNKTLGKIVKTSLKSIE